MEDMTWAGAAQTAWVWAFGALLLLTFEVTLGTHLYLLALACGAAAVSALLWMGVPERLELEGWHAPVLAWCGASLVFYACVWKFRDRFAGKAEDPNRPLGRTAAVAGYEGKEEEDAR